MTSLQPPSVPAFIPATSSTDQLNVMSDALRFLLAKSVFRARRTTTGAVTRNGHTLIPFDQIDEDPYGGWTGPTAYTVQAPGWYAISATASVTGTGADGTVLIPAVSIDGSSPTGTGNPGWEGPELFIPVTGPQAVGAYWEAYCLLGSTIEIDVFLSSEPAVDLSWRTTAGAQSRIEIVWMGV